MGFLTRGKASLRALESEDTRISSITRINCDDPAAFPIRGLGNFGSASSEISRYQPRTGIQKIKIFPRTEAGTIAPPYCRTYRQTTRSTGSRHRQTTKGKTKLLSPTTICNNEMILKRSSNEKGKNRGITKLKLLFYCRFEQTTLGQLELPEVRKKNSF